MFDVGNDAGHDVVQHGHDAVAVTDQALREVVRDVEHQLHLFTRGLVLKVLQSTVEKVGNAHGFLLEYYVAVTQFAEIRQLVDQYQHVFTGHADGLKVITLTGRQWRVAHEFTHADHPINRGAQLVADLPHGVWRNLCRQRLTDARFADICHELGEE